LLFVVVVADNLEHRHPPPPPLQTAAVVGLQQVERRSLPGSSTPEAGPKHIKKSEKMVYTKYGK
jgi:hypothetical protein